MAVVPKNLKLTSGLSWFVNKEKNVYKVKTLTVKHNLKSRQSIVIGRISCKRDNRMRKRKK